MFKRTWARVIIGKPITRSNNIIVISNMCPGSASTETVGVVSDTREIISRPFVFLKYFLNVFQLSYLRKTNII